jgi:multidrug efflux pump subunit AcrB
LLLLLLTPFVLLRTPTDIFPAIDIPVVSVVWTAPWGSNPAGSCKNIK